MASALKELRQIFARANSADPKRIVLFQTAPEFQGELVELLCELAVAAKSCVGRVLALVSSDSPGNDDIELFGSEENFADVESPLSAAESIAFAASLELGSLIAELSQVDESSNDPLEICELAWGRIRKCALAVIESNLNEGEPLDLDSAQFDLENARDVRRVFTNLRRNIPSYDPNDADSVLAAIRRTGNGIAAIMGGPSFCRIRVADRKLLRSLHTRCIEWMRDKNHRGGQHLCSDIRSSLDLLQGINRRDELRKHDGEVLRRVLGTFASCEIVVEWKPLLGELAQIHGRCDRLDTLVAAAQGPESGAADELMEQVVALADDLGIAREIHQSKV